MLEEYFEIFIIPSGQYDIFASFILDETSQAIEEAECIADDTYTLYNISSVPTLAKSNAIILRLSESPANLLENIKQFSLTLSKRLSNKIGFAYKIYKKRNIDWISAYRESVIPIQCGRFYIHPSWHKPKADLENIIIDPALAFGSGHHASTAMCVELLGNLDLCSKNALDVGCGSGILGIVMAKLGARVTLCDVDELAIQETQKNFSLNNVKYDRIWCGSIENTSEKYDVICANILADIIVCLHNELKDNLRVGGTLILSGIIQDRAQDILNTFIDFELKEMKTKDEWVCLKLILVD